MSLDRSRRLRRSGGSRTHVHGLVALVVLLGVLVVAGTGARALWRMPGAGTPVGLETSAFGRTRRPRRARPPPSWSLVLPPAWGLENTPDALLNASAMGPLGTDSQNRGRLCSWAPSPWPWSAMSSCH